jgi:hypothetical protein
MLIEAGTATTSEMGASCFIETAGDVAGVAHSGGSGS